MKLRSILILSCAISFALFTTSCNKKQQKKPTTESQISISMTPSNETPASIEDTKGLVTQRWHATNKRICVLFGYNFNDADTTNSYLYILQNEFGLDSEGGLIYPVIYPTSFKHGTNAYVSDFKEILRNSFKDTDLIGLVLLGAPENTHIILESLQDENDLVFPVFALFPQDNNFGLEATCDLIIEKSQGSADVIESNEEGLDEIANLAPDVLLNSINYISTLDEMRLSLSDIENQGETREGVITGAFPTDPTMIEHIARILKGHTFKNYVDHDTGISSFNHFVID